MRGGGVCIFFTVCWLGFHTRGLYLFERAEGRDRGGAGKRGGCGNASLCIDLMAIQ